MIAIVGAGRTRQITARRIDQATATRLAAAEHLPVTPAVAYDGAVDLWPDRPVTTREEVRVLAVFLGRTDAPVRWHGGDVTWGRS